MIPAFRRAAATAAAGAVLALTACSSPLSTGPAAPTTLPPTTTTIKGASTPAQTEASNYRAQLTYLMVEQVYLLGRVTQAAVAAPASGGPTTTTGSGASTTSTLPPAVVGPTADAASALDTSSHDISDWLSAAEGYGTTFNAAFYPLWSQRMEDFLAYAKAKAVGYTPGSAAATAALAANATAIAKLVHSTNKYVAITTVTNPGTGLADELAPDNQGVTNLIDDQVAGASTAAADLVTAAELMYHTADYLAAAAAKLDPDQYPGTADGTAANLRSSLTMVLVEHVELASLQLAAIGNGLPEGPWAAVVATNTTELHNAIAANFSDQAATGFSSLWNGYISDLVAYARSKATGDQAAASDAAGRLSGVAPAVGAFFHAQSGQLDANAVTVDLSPVVSGLQGVADATTGHAPAATLTREAGGFVPKLASDVSEAIALRHPSLYAP